MTNPLYFKTGVINGYDVAISVMGLFFIGFNIYHNRKSKEELNLKLMGPIAFLTIPSIIDNVFDIITGYDSKNFTTTLLSVLVGLMFVACVLSVAFGIYHIIKVSTAYSELIDTDEALNSIEKKGTFTMFEVMTLKSALRYYHINIFLLCNFTVALIFINIWLLVTYVMRLYTFLDENITRELDVSIYALIFLIAHVLVVILDYVFRKKYTAPLFGHYLSGVFFMISNLSELDRYVKVLELLTTLMIFVVSIPLIVIKILYWMNYKKNTSIK